VVASPSRTATPPPIEQVAPPEPSLSSHDVEKATPSKKSILKKLTPHKKPDAPPPPPKEGKTADSKQDPESGKKNLGGTTIHRRSVAAAKTSVE
jgi:hypothetical protein